ncbi:MAG: MarR family transcriptional regulator [Wenzhouxiangellaceae bacterium]
MPKTLDLEHFLPYRLSLLSNLVSRGIALHYQQTHGLSVTQWRIIAVLRRYPGLTASELVERTAMDKVAIHRAVRGLLNDGLVRRREAVDDRRRLLLSLSDTGIYLHSQIAPKAQAFEAELLACLSDDEQRLLDRVIGKLTRRADEACQQIETQLTAKS